MLEVTYQPLPLPPEAETRTSREDEKTEMKTDKMGTIESWWDDNSVQTYKPVKVCVNVMSFCKPLMLKWWFALMKPPFIPTKQFKCWIVFCICLRFLWSTWILISRLMESMRQWSYNCRKSKWIEGLARLSNQVAVHLSNFGCDRPISGMNLVWFVLNTKMGRTRIFNLLFIVCDFLFSGFKLECVLIRSKEMLTL